MELQGFVNYHGGSDAVGPGLIICSENDSRTLLWIAGHC